MFWFNIKKRIGFTKKAPNVKSSVNDWIINYPHVIVSPINITVSRIMFLLKMDFFCKVNIVEVFRYLRKYMVRTMS